jgi:hypothetical protein
VPALFKNNPRHASILPSSLVGRSLVVSIYSEFRVLENETEEKCEKGIRAGSKECRNTSTRVLRPPGASLSMTSQ